MNKNAKLWVKALRSGRFQQTKRRLAVVNEGYCCLGVACELYIAQGNELTKEVDADNVVKYGEQRAVLPKPVIKWLGLKTPSGLVGTGKGELSAMNDSGYTFQQLADFIEQTPALFE